MPTVDFTLNDIKKLIHEETPVIVDQALVKERVHTRSMVQTMINESAEDMKRSIREEFLNFWETNLGPTLDELHDEIREIKHNIAGLGRLVDRHSKDIMALRSHQS